MTVKIPHKLSLQSPHFYKQSTCEKVRELIFLIIHNHEDKLQEKLTRHATRKTFPIQLV